MKKLYVVILVIVLLFALLLAIGSGYKRDTLTHQGKFKKVNQLEQQLEDSLEFENPGWDVDVKISFEKGTSKD